MSTQVCSRRFFFQIFVVFKENMNFLNFFKNMNLKVFTCQYLYIFFRIFFIYFRCNDENKVSISEEDLEDKKTGMKYKKISIEVTRNDVMDVLGKFSCKCHASSAKGEVTSAEAVVKQACKLNLCTT